MKDKTSPYSPTIDFFLKTPSAFNNSLLKQPTFFVSFCEDGQLQSLKIKTRQTAHAAQTDDHSKKHFSNKKIRSRFATLKKILQGYFKGDLKILEEVYPWLDFSATPFQKRVWMTMLDEKEFCAGCIASYENLAKRVVENLQNKRDKKYLPTRAVASAVAKNPFFLLVPCHRIVPKHSIEKSKKIKELNPVKIIETMDIGQYGGGAFLKKQLLLHEAKFAKS